MAESGDTPYRIEIVPRAANDLEKLPSKVAAACVAFIFSTLADDPRRVTKPLTRELAGLASARRGSYRIIVRIDEGGHRVEVLHVAHRSHVYRT